MPGEGQEQAPLGWAKTLLQRANNGGFSEEDLRSKSFIELIDQKYKEKEDEKQNKNTFYDLPDLQKAKTAKAAYYEDRTASTWRERLSYMWRPDEYGNLSPELQFVYETSFGSFLVAALFGSYTESAKIYRIFLEQNKYTMFQHPREAQRALQDRVVLAMLQGGWRAGWRLGLLTLIFTSTCQSLTVVRNYINPLDYALGGVAAGAIYRFNMGPKGMVGAGLAGGIYGLGAGVLVAGIQLVSGETVAERWSHEFRAMEDKKRAKEAALQKKETGMIGDKKEIMRTEAKVVVLPEEQTPYVRDSEDWTRIVTIKVTKLFEKIGILRSSNRDYSIESEDLSEKGFKTESETRESNVS